AIAGSVTFNAGQACVAGTRLIVEKSVADRLTTAILEKMKAVRPGPTWDEATHYSPIISERQRARVDSIVRAAVAAGGECLTGGAAMDSRGYFYAPTLIA
ncbi:aldehyde dehydrogenase family protein, partial [bacterium M00.F.Ca.ET.222.01.1.1]